MLHAHVPAATKVLTALIFLNFGNFGTKRDTTKSYDHSDGSLSDLTILFRGFLTYLSPFQSQGGLRKLEQSIIF